MTISKIYYACIVITCLSISSLFSTVIQHYNLMIVDTTEREKVIYKPFIDLLNSVGFNVTYTPLDALIDKTPTELALSNYNAVFFIIGVEFLGGLNRSYICSKVLELLEIYALKPSVLIGLLFPPLRAQPGMNIIGACAPIFNRLGITTPDDAYRFLQSVDNNAVLKSNVTEVQKKIQAFFYMANVFLGVPLETRPAGYHTSLSMPHGGIEFPAESIGQLTNRVSQPLYFLPINNQASTAIFKTLPYGLYWFNPIRKNHIFISTSTVCSFSSIAENFHICPTDFELRHEMLKLIQNMLFEVNLLSRTTTPPQIMNITRFIKKLPIPDLPSSIQCFGAKKSFDKSTQSQEKIAWMEINVFEDVSAEQREKNQTIDAEREQKRSKLIDYILQANLDALWITFNPQMYYSHRARLPGKEHEQKFLMALSRFTAMLKTAACKRNSRTPALWLGYEITNNIYEPHMPTHYAVDLYENTYNDLPVATDLSFWQTEIVKPLEVFMKKWKTPTISNGLKISGVVLDLEMYCRKKTGTYSTGMGFDAQTFKKFAHLQKKHDWDAVALRDRVLVLLRAKLTGAYFRYLEHEATSIGRYLNRSITRIIPDCSIICYLPHINVSWFYKGLYKGLAETKKCLKLLTFNTEFFAHEEWFKQLGVTIEHSSVLLLSKVAKREDFCWVDYVLAHHHGIWLNRFSRFVEPKAKDWTSVEQPGLEEEEYDQFMSYLNNKGS